MIDFVGERPSIAMPNSALTYSITLTMTLGGYKMYRSHSSYMNDFRGVGWLRVKGMCQKFQNMPKMAYFCIMHST